ncbi:hypothetical protein QQF64_027577 [Cirrhinus molitorella]|uniref:Uncharacterized protein n=1 Tax=Cirrhinus molitorella TaxID=172907 RepID=A0ABR3NDE5_9TELE
MLSDVFRRLRDVSKVNGILGLMLTGSLSSLVAQTRPEPMGWQHGDCHLPAALYDVRRTQALLTFPPIKGRGPTFLTRMGFEDKH